MTRFMLVLRTSVFSRYKSLVGLRELPAATGENCVLMLRKLCPLRPGAHHVGVTKVPLLFLFLFVLFTFHPLISCRPFKYVLFFLIYFPLYCHFSVQCTAVSQGGRLPAAGVQTGAHPPAGRAHPAALCTHVLHPETLFGIPQEDRHAAGAVPRLPHKVSQASFSSYGLATK